MKTTVTAADAPAAIGPYSQAVACGTLIFLSGQIGLDPASGELVEGGTEAETEQVLRNLSAILATDNLTLDTIVRTTIYLVDLGDFARVNEIYGRHFHAPYPARATVGVAALPRGARVEIDAIAMKQD
jgi:2-iminobutanoate/2-iminopropanoate deaminase